MRRRWAAALLVAFLGTAPLIASPAAPAASVERAGQPALRADTCPDSAGVTVVVDFAELGGGVKVACASGLSARSRGSDALAAAGIAWSAPVNQPGFVCRLDGRPAAGEAFGTANDGDYRETCVDTPPADAHWSYWQSTGDGNWSYSNSGLTSTRVTPGGFEGWSFSTGALLPPDYNPIGGDDSEPLPQPEPQPVPPPQPQPEPAPQPEQPADPAPEPQAQPTPAQPAAPEPAPPADAAPAATAAAESPTTADAATTTAATSIVSAPSSASRTSSTSTASTSASVSALADPVTETSGSGGWVLGGAALIAALAGAAFVVVRHRRHG